MEITFKMRLRLPDVSEVVEDVVLAVYQRCTLKDDISYLLPT